MHPRTPKLLSELIAIGDLFLRADKAFEPLPFIDAARFDSLDRELREIHDKPDDGSEKLIDDVTFWLVKALRHAAADRHGVSKKWVELAKSLMPFVRTDMAAAIGAAHLPDRGDAP